MPLDAQIESELRTLARIASMPFGAIAYAAYAGSTSKEDTEKELKELVREELPLEDEVACIVESGEKPASASKRVGFREQVLSRLDHFRKTGRIRGNQEKALRKLGSLQAELPALLRRVDETLASHDEGSEAHTTQLPEVSEETDDIPEPPSEAQNARKSIKRPTLIVLVRRLEDLGHSAESVALGIRAIIGRSAHLLIPGEEIDTRTPVGRKITRAYLRAGTLKAVAARARSADDLARRRKDLRVYGPVPFAFERQGDSLKPIQEQLAVVKRIRELSRMGETPFSIAVALTREKHSWKDGTNWTWPRVKQILENPIYEQVLPEASA